jgi:hypothetical protein
MHIRVNALLRLLGARSLLATNILLQVSSIMSLFDEALDRVPCLPGDWWCGLIGQRGINFRGQVLHALLHKGALSVTGAEESGIQDNEDPCTLLEENCGEEDAEPKGDFEEGDESHGAIIVVFDKFANGVAEAGSLWFGTRGSGGCLWLDRGQQVRACVSQDVEDGVDGEGEDGEGNLAVEEPCKGNDLMAC